MGSRVLGLDLSLTSTGVAAITSDGGTVSRIASKAKPGATLAQRGARLADLVEQITTEASGWPVHPMPALVVVEGPSFGQARQGGQHDRAGLWWLVVAQLLDWHIPVAEVPPALCKKYATGKGNAGKDEVLAAVIRRYPSVEVTGNDQADALVLAAMGADHLGVPIVDMPATHRTALAKVAWPQMPTKDGAPA
jgi:Holliday junction resolvasome RuvABC endonuclease subunit